MIRCEFDDCENTAYQTVSGIACCNRCAAEFVSAGLGVTRFAGSWHGVRGAKYSADIVATFALPAVRLKTEVSL